MKVYIASRSRGKNQGRYHRDPDCRYIQQALNPRETTREALTDDWSECVYCDPNEKPDHGGSHGPQLASQIEGLAVDEDNGGVDA